MLHLSFSRLFFLLWLPCGCALQPSESLFSLFLLGTRAHKHTVHSTNWLKVYLVLAVLSCPLSDRFEHTHTHTQLNWKKKERARAVHQRLTALRTSSTLSASHSVGQKPFFTTPACRSHTNHRSTNLPHPLSLHSTQRASQKKKTVVFASSSTFSEEYPFSFLAVQLGTRGGSRNERDKGYLVTAGKVVDAFFFRPHRNTSSEDVPGLSSP